MLVVKDNVMKVLSFEGTNVQLAREDTAHNNFWGIMQWLLKSKDAFIKVGDVCLQLTDPNTIQGIDEFQVEYASDGVPYAVLFKHPTLRGLANLFYVEFAKIGLTLDYVEALTKFGVTRNVEQKYVGELIDLRNSIAVDAVNSTGLPLFIQEKSNLVDYSLILRELMKSIDRSLRWELPTFSEGFSKLPLSQLIEQRTVVLKTARQTGFTEWALNKASSDPRTYVILGDSEMRSEDFYADKPNVTGSFFRGDITQYDLIIVDTPLKHDIKMLLSTALTVVKPEELAKSNVRFLIGY